MTQEREQIVAWLREQKGIGMQAAVNAPLNSKRERDCVAVAIAIGNAADAIERGDHLLSLPTGGQAVSKQPKCPHCGSGDLHRVMVMKPPYPQEIRCRACEQYHPINAENESVKP